MERIKPDIAKQILKELRNFKVSVENRFDDLETEMRKGFKGVNYRLDKVENRLDKVENRLDKVENRLDNVEKEVRELNKKVGQNRNAIGTIVEKLIGFSAPKIDIRLNGKRYTFALEETNKITDLGEIDLVYKNQKQIIVGEIKATISPEKLDKFKEKFGKIKAEFKNKDVYPAMFTTTVQDTYLRKRAKALKIILIAIEGTEKYNIVVNPY